MLKWLAARKNKKALRQLLADPRVLKIWFPARLATQAAARQAKLSYPLALGKKTGKPKGVPARIIWAWAENEVTQATETRVGLLTDLDVSDATKTDSLLAMRMADIGEGFYDKDVEAANASFPDWAEDASLASRMALKVIANRYAKRAPTGAVLPRREMIDGPTRAEVQDADLPPDEMTAAHAFDKGWLADEVLRDETAHPKFRAWAAWTVFCG